MSFAGRFAQPSTRSTVGGALLPTTPRCKRSFFRVHEPLARGQVRLACQAAAQAGEHPGRPGEGPWDQQRGQPSRRSPSTLMNSGGSTAATRSIGQRPCVPDAPVVDGDGYSVAGLLEVDEARGHLGIWAECSATQVWKWAMRSFYEDQAVS